MTDPLDDEEEFPEPPRLRALRLMVSALVAVLIAGMIVVAGALIWRLTRDTPAPPPIRAEAVTLPAGEVITALGGDAGALMISTRDEAGVERLRAFDRTTGAAREVVEISRAPKSRP